MKLAAHRVAFFLLTFVLTGSLHAQRPITSAVNLFHPVDQSRLEFIPNRGQVADQYGKPMPDVLYTTEARGTKVFFTSHSLQFVFSRVERYDTLKWQLRTEWEDRLPNGSAADSNSQARVDSVRFFRLDLSFEGARQSPLIEAFDEADDYTNYYFTHCPNGILHVPGYHKLIYHDLYPNIDMVVYTSAGYSKKSRHDTATIEDKATCEYDFIVHPGGDPSQIRMHYINPDSLFTTDNGEAIVTTALGFIRDRLPFTYLAGSETPVESKFIVSGSTISILTAPYDSTKTLVIDPPRLWGTYYGGPAWDEFRGLTTDKDDNIIAVGSTQSASGISSPGAFQTSLAGSIGAMIVKFSPTGSRLWATYYGRETRAWATITDQSGDVYAGGGSGGYSGLATPGAFQTTPTGSFLVKFDPSGTRLWGTYYGTVASLAGLAIDSFANVYFTGSTTDMVGIATPGTYQTSIVSNSLAGFVTSFTPVGIRRWGTYLSGAKPQNSGLGITKPETIAVSSYGNVVIGGLTQDTIGIATSGAFETVYLGSYTSNAGFAVQFDSVGQRTWGTYFASPVFSSGEYTEVHGLGYDRNNCIVVGGLCNIGGLATAGAYQSSLNGNNTGFLVRLDTAGHRIWGTYTPAALSGLALDKSYDIVTGGTTWATSGVASSGEYQTTYGGGIADAYIAKFTTSGSFRWATYYGGSDYDGTYTFALDREGHPVTAGFTLSSNAIASPGAFLTTYPAGSTQSGFIVKFCDTVHAPIFFNKHTSQVCYGELDTLTAGVGFLNYQWKQNGTPITGVTGNRLPLPVLAPGSYKFTVSVVDPSACSSNTDTLPLTVLAPPSVTLTRDTSICIGSGVPIGGAAHGAGPPFIYSWTPAIGLDHPDSARPLATPHTTTTYYLFVSDTNGCQLFDSVRVQVNDLPKLNAGGNKSVCLGSGVQIGAQATQGTPGYTYQWTPGTGLSDSLSATVTASPAVTTKYFVRATDRYGCDVEDSVVVTVHQHPHPPVLFVRTVCRGDAVALGGQSTGGTPPYQYAWSPNYRLSDPSVQYPLASPDTNTTYQVTVIDANGCDTTVMQRVTVLPAAVKPVIAMDRSVVYCAADSVTLDAGAGYNGYFWSTGAACRTIKAAAGNYTVTVTDSNGCSATSDPVSITRQTLPPILVTGALSDCPGATTVYRSRDNGVSSYSWSLTGGGSIQGSNALDSVVVNWSSTGSWKLTLRETMSSSNCELDTTLTITIDNALHPTVTPSGKSTVCAGDTITLRASSGYQGYTWNTGEKSAAIEVWKSGDYSVTVTNSAGCVGTSAVVHVTVAPDKKPAPVIAAARTRICEGDSVVLSTTEPFSQYLWSNGQSTPTITVRQAGSYTVHVTNAVGCEATSDSVRITVDPLPVVRISADGPVTFCEGDSVRLVATPGYRYVWFDGSRQLPDTMQTVTAQKTGSYHVTATNGAGCSAQSNTIDVTVKPAPHPVIAGPASLCIGGSAGYRTAIDAGSVIAWHVTPSTLGTIQTGQGTDSVYVAWSSTPAAGILAVTVTNPNGCSATASLPITIDSRLTPLVTADGPLAFCEGESVTLDAGSGYASYQWSKDGSVITGATANKLIVNTSGSYTAYVTDVSGCSGTSSAQVVTVYPLPAKPLITRTGKQLTSTAASSYLWTYQGQSIAPTTQTIDASQFGTGAYTVTIADSHGCSNTSDPSDFENKASVTVSLPALSKANPGDHINVPLIVLSQDRLADVGATVYVAKIRFNATILAPDAKSTAATGNDRVLTVTGTLPTSLPNAPFVLQQIPMTATLGTDTCSDLVIDTFYFTDADVQVTRENGELCLSGVCFADGHVRLIDPSHRISLGIARPNPSNDHVQIDYELAEEGRTKLVIQDMLGRTVLTVRDEVLKAGSYHEEIDLRPLASGAYRYLLITASQQLSNQMEVVK